MCILHCWTTSILLPLLIFNLKAKARKEGGNLNKHLQDARKMFSLHLTVPPDSSSPGERPFNLLARRQQTSHHVSYHRRALHRDPGALGPRNPTSLLCSAFVFLTYAQIHSGLAGSSRSWATSGLWQVMDYSGLCHCLLPEPRQRGRAGMWCSFCLVKICFFTLNSPGAFWQRY